MQILLTIAYASLFVFLIGKMRYFRLPGISQTLMKAGFIIKLIAGVGVGLVYTYYYTDRLTADTFKFFDDSLVLFNSLQTEPYDFFRMLTGINASAPELQHYYNTMTNWYDTFSPFNDNRTMIRLNTVLRFISLGHYYVHVVIVCFLSYIGIVAIIRVFAEEYPGLIRELFLVFILMPSVLFWGSGLLKDALVFFTFGMVLLYFSKLVRDSPFRMPDLLRFIVSMLILMITKFQVFLISFPVLIPWFIARRFKTPVTLTFLVTGVCFFSALYLVSLFSDSINTVQLLVNKQQAFIELARSAWAGSAIEIPVLEPTLQSLLFNAPAGFATSLFRPFITDSGSMLILASALENMVILLFGAYCLTRFKPANIQNRILPGLCLFYTLYSFTLIGMITPVLGAIVRYKAQALPFLMAFFIIMAQPASVKLLNRLVPKTKF